MFETLKRNIGLNAAGNVRPQRVALGESSGTVQLVETAGESLSCTRVARQGETGSEDVTVTTLDAFVAENGIPRLDLIKIDIEGSEARFLRGAANSLRRWHPVLLIEINPAVLEQFGSTAAEVASLLSDLGYQLYRSSLTGLRPLRELPIAPQYVNGVAIAASDPSS
jgi:FkbM family methyltransferase